LSEKTLIIHQGALGDVILTFPAIQCLKEERNTSVVLLCKDQVGGIARALKIVDGHLPVESARFCALFSRELRHDMKGFLRDYDTIVLVGFSSEMEKGIRENHSGETCRIAPRPPAGEETHVAVHVIKQMQAEGLLRSTGNLRLQIGGFGLCKSGPLLRRKGTIQNGKPKSEQRVSLSCQGAIDERESRQPENILVIHPGSGSRRKEWPLENFIEVAVALSRRSPENVTLLIGPAEKNFLSLVREEAMGRFPIYEVEALAQVMTLMGSSRCFVGNDSGLTHMAAFMGVPTVAIFGPSSPRRWSPVGPRTKVLRGDADCVPCFEMEEANCENPKCLNEVSVEMVLEAMGYGGGN